MVKKIWIIFLIISWIMLNSHCQKRFFKNTGAMVTYVEGRVELIDKKGNIQRLRPGDPIRKGDDIRTWDDSRAIIQFDKMGIMGLAPKTLLTIEQLYHENVSELFLLNGGILVNIIHIQPDKDKFFIKSSSFTVSAGKGVFGLKSLQGEERVHAADSKVAILTKESFGEIIIPKWQTAIIKKTISFHKSPKSLNLILDAFSDIKMISRKDLSIPEKMNNYSQYIQTLFK